MSIKGNPNLNHLPDLDIFSIRISSIKINWQSQFAFLLIQKHHRFSELMDRKQLPGMFTDKILIVDQPVNAFDIRLKLFINNQVEFCRGKPILRPVSCLSMFVHLGQQAVSFLEVLLGLSLICYLQQFKLTDLVFRVIKHIKDVFPVVFILDPPASYLKIRLLSLAEVIIFYGLCELIDRIKTKGLSLMLEYYL